MPPGTYTVAGRMLFDYSPTTGVWYKDIDVVNVWDLEVIQLTTGKTTVKFQTVFTVQDALPMVDGPFATYRAAFNFSLTELGNGNFSGSDGALTFYKPDGTVYDPDNNSSNGTSEHFTTDRNGEFGATGVYSMNNTKAANFKAWAAHDIVTFVTPGAYSLESGLFWNNYAAMPSDGIAANNINFAIPGASSVPEPASLLLIGAGLTGLVGLRRKQ